MKASVRGAGIVFITAGNLALQYECHHGESAKPLTSVDQKLKVSDRKIYFFICTASPFKELMQGLNKCSESLHVFTVVNAFGHFQI